MTPRERSVASPLPSGLLSFFALRSYHRSAFCVFCESEQTFRGPSFAHVVHIALSIFTLGLWLVPYFSFWWYRRRAAGWRCRECGHRFRPDGHRDGAPGDPPSAAAHPDNPQPAVLARIGKTLTALTGRIAKDR